MSETNKLNLIRGREGTLGVSNLPAPFYHTQK